MLRGHISSPSANEVKTVTIKIIPNNEQRYPTAGDWIYNEATGDLQVRVSATKDWRESMAVAVHELVEATLCIQDGVEPDLVDSFDMHFENHRADDDYSEPGDDPRAPYYDQHQVATNVEHVYTTALGLHWDTYNEHLGELDDDDSRSDVIPGVPAVVGGRSAE